MPKNSPDVTYSFGRGDLALQLYTDKNGGSAIFEATEYGANFDPAEYPETLYADLSASPADNLAVLVLTSLVNGVVVAEDLVTFHQFTSVVVAIGGLGQSPLQQGGNFFKMPRTLYEEGYDVWMYSEKEISDNPANANQSAAFTVIKRVLTETGASEYALFGYSKGAGKSRAISQALFQDVGNAAFVGYIDGIVAGGGPSEGQPPRADYFFNYYQRHWDPSQLFLRGQAIVGAHKFLNVNTVIGGENIKHNNIDDEPFVQADLLAALKGQIDR